MSTVLTTSTTLALPSFLASNMQSFVCLIAKRIPRFGGMEDLGALGTYLAILPYLMYLGY